MTTGDIARELGRSLHQVTYALQRLRITEDARAGTYRLFRRERLPQLSAQICSIGRREEVQPSTLDGGKVAK